MSPIVKTGVVFGVVVVLLQLAMGFTGLYDSPNGALVFTLLATAVTIVMVVWGLTQTARLGNGYGPQVLAGLGICAVASVFIVAGTFLFDAMFPDWVESARQLRVEGFEEQGMSQTEIEAELERRQFMFTPIGQALGGLVGTFATGLVVSLIAAIFLRDK